MTKNLSTSESAEAIKPYPLYALSDLPRDPATGRILFPKSPDDFVKDEEPEEIVITYSEAELEAKTAQAHQQGVEEGKAQGLAEGKGQRLEVDQQLTIVVQDLTQKITTIDEELGNYKQQLHNDALSIALLAAKKLGGDAIAEEPTESLKNGLDAALAKVSNKQSIVLTLHPEMQEAISSHLSTQYTHLTIDITPDETLAKNDATLRWDKGGADVDSEALWQEIEGLIEKLKV